MTQNTNMSCGEIIMLFITLCKFPLSTWLELDQDSSGELIFYHELKGIYY